MKSLKRILPAVMIFIIANGIELYAQQTIHPRNQMLVSKGLVPKDILKYFPDVPKITPAEALSLYQAKKAVFIGVGHDVPRLPDGWLLKDYMSFDPRRLARYGIPTQGVILVLYCG